MTAAVVGTLAAVLTVTSFVPQAWKIWKTRQTSGLATPMWVLSTSAFALWTIYGVFLTELPIIIPNAICCVLAGFILAMKLKASARTRARRSGSYNRYSSASRQP